MYNSSKSLSSEAFAEASPSTPGGMSEHSQPGASATAISVKNSSNELLYLYGRLRKEWKVILRIFMCLDPVGEFLLNFCACRRWARRWWRPWNLGAQLSARACMPSSDNRSSSMRMRRSCLNISKAGYSAGMTCTMYSDGCPCSGASAAVVGGEAVDVAPPVRRCRQRTWPVARA